jgi:HEAT repeat protein
MARTGEVEPLVNAIESHEDAEVRLAAIRLLKMSGQEELATEAVNQRLKPNRII